MTMGVRTIQFHRNLAREPVQLELSFITSQITSYNRMYIDSCECIHICVRDHNYFYYFCLLFVSYMWNRLVPFNYYFIPLPVEVEWGQMRRIRIFEKQRETINILKWWQQNHGNSSLICGIYNKIIVSSGKNIMQICICLKYELPHQWKYIFSIYLLILCFPHHHRLLKRIRSILNIKLQYYFIFVTTNNIYLLI